MKHLGRAIGTIGLVIGVVGIAYFTKEGCVPATGLIIGMICIWASA